MMFVVRVRALVLVHVRGVEGGWVGRDLEHGYKISSYWIVFP